MNEKAANVSFDALLDFALQENARRELAFLPTPAELKAAYPDTAAWDTRLQKALRARRHKGRPLRVVRRTLLVAAVLMALLTCTLLASGEVRYAVKNAIMEWTGIEVRLTYDTEGEQPENMTLPEGYTDHVVLDGFALDEKNILDEQELLFHAYNKEKAGKNYSYTVDCYVIRPSGQLETFDNEHTVYTTVKVGETEATLGTSSNFDGSTSYYLFWDKDGISHTVHGNVSLDEMLEVAKGIY